MPDEHLNRVKNHNPNALPPVNLDAPRWRRVRETIYAYRHGFLQHPVRIDP